MPASRRSRSQTWKSVLPENLDQQEAPPDGTAVPADQPTEINNRQGWEDDTAQSTVVGHGTTTPPTNDVG